MDVHLLYFDGCPNWQETDERLREAIAVAGLAATVEYVEVTSPEDAERLRFRGSPTVLVDGADPFADAAAPIGLSCRVFQTSQGLRGAPTVEQLVTAMAGARRPGDSSAADLRMLRGHLPPTLSGVSLPRGRCLTQCVIP